MTFDSPWQIPGINERLTELHAQASTDYLSMAEIAAKLNAEFKVKLTRNSVIGRSRRLKMALRDPVLERPKTIERPHKPRFFAPIPPPMMPRGEGVKGLTILQLRDGDCKWPLGAMEDYPPFFYCGEPAKDGCPWCPVHYSKAHAHQTVSVNRRNIHG